jgi:enoyl-CoA hydratase/carnithine racemase
MPAVHSELAGGVLRIEMRRVEKKNALDKAMYAAMAQALAAAEADPAARVVLLHGQPGFFTAGADIHDFLERPPGATDTPPSRFLEAIVHASKPIVAAVSGLAVGIGTTMLLHCDHVVAGEGARFSTPFARLGLCPEAGSSVMLPLTVGYKRAAEMVLFGEPIDAATALAWGLVNAVVPDARVLEVASERARTLASRPAGAILASKELLKRRIVALAAAAMHDEAREFARLLHSAAAREMLSAFAEKRQPDPSKVS